MSARMAILLRGLPGSGKTTTAALLRDALSPSVRVSDDSVRYMAHPRDFTALTLEASERACMELALSYCDSGFLPIIDGVFMDAGFLIHQVLRFRRYGYQLIVISLVADILDLINRNLSRDPFAQMDEKRIRELHSTFSPVGFPLGIRDKLPEEVRDDILTIVGSQETAGQAGSRKTRSTCFSSAMARQNPRREPPAHLRRRSHHKAGAKRWQPAQRCDDLPLTWFSPRTPPASWRRPGLPAVSWRSPSNPPCGNTHPWGSRACDEIHHASGQQAAEAESGKGDAVGVPPGDSYDDARKRVRSFFNGLAEARRGKRVLIVGHSDQHAWLIERAIGTELKAARLPRWDTGCFSRFTLSAHQTRLEAMNTGPESVVRDLDPGPPPENFTQNCRTEADWKPRHHP